MGATQPGKERRTMRPLGIIEFGSILVIRVVSLVAVSIAPGVDYFPGFLDRAAQAALRDDVAAILSIAPLFRPRMPRTGKPFSVKMSNCGPLG
jgi:alkylated DNA repair dioxygenase AlkB